MATDALVYVPGTSALLRELAGGADLPSGTQVLIPELTAEQLGPDEAEAAQFDALYDAAAASAAVLVETADRPRRVVFAASVAAEDLTRDGDQWSTTTPIHLAQIQAVYVDEEEAEADVEALVSAVRAGQEPTEAMYDAVEGRHLLWFGPDELPTLI